MQKACLRGSGVAFTAAKGPGLKNLWEIPSTEAINPRSSFLLMLPQYNV